MTSVWYVKNLSANFDGSLYCKLHEKWHRVTGPLKRQNIYYLIIFFLTKYSNDPANVMRTSAFTEGDSIDGFRGEFCLKRCFFIISVWAYLRLTFADFYYRKCDLD